MRSTPNYCTTSNLNGAEHAEHADFKRLQITENIKKIKTCRRRRSILVYFGITLRGYRVVYDCYVELYNNSRLVRPKKRCLMSDLGQKTKTIRQKYAFATIDVSSRFHDGNFFNFTVYGPFYLEGDDLTLLSDIEIIRLNLSKTTKSVTR